MASVGGNKTAVPTPHIIRSAEVTNKGHKQETVTVYYKNTRDGETIRLTTEVPAGKTFHFQELNLDMGGWKACAPVMYVACGSKKLVPKVNTVVPKVLVSIKAGGVMQQTWPAHQG